MPSITTMMASHKKQRLRRITQYSTCAELGILPPVVCRPCLNKVSTVLNARRVSNVSEVHKLCCEQPWYKKMGASTLERHRNTHMPSWKQLVSIGYPGTLSRKPKKKEVALKQGAKVSLKQGAPMPSVPKKSVGAHAAGAGGKFAGGASTEQRGGIFDKSSGVSFEKGALMPDIFRHNEMSIQKKKLFGCSCWGRWQSAGITNERV